MSVTDPSQPRGLHPNIARVAASYDQIIERLRSNQISNAQAFELIEQLEARDDQGVRWSIDAASGRWIRRTMQGHAEFDTPPTSGYQTHDAFSYTQPDPFAAPTADGPLVANPNARLELTEIEHDSALHRRHAGRTRRAAAGSRPTTPGALLLLWWGVLPPLAKVLLALAVVVAACWAW